MKTASSFITAFVLTLFSFLPNAFANSTCDFDGDGMSEFVLVTQGAGGNYDWRTFNPRTGSSQLLIQGFGNASSKLIPGNWVDSNQAIAAVVDPVSAGPRGRATWTVRSGDSYTGSTYNYTRNLGRPGDIIILGGDYDGNGVTDSLILKRTTGKLGLRVNFFLSNYDGNNLGKERLYKALGKPFIDKNFFFSPDGNNDYLGILKKGGSGDTTILMLKPFTDTPQSISMGVLPSGVQGPLALKEGSGTPDLLAFYVVKKSGTSIIIKNQSGITVGTKQLNGSGTVLVGDYLSDSGYEIAVQGSNSLDIYNPNTKRVVTVALPAGQLVSCVGNQLIQ